MSTGVLLFGRDPASTARGGPFSANYLACGSRNRVGLRSNSSSAGVRFGPVRGHVT